MRIRTSLLFSGFIIILILLAGCTEDTPNTVSPGTGSAAGAGPAGIRAGVAAMDSILPSTYLQFANLDVTYIDFELTNPTGTARTVVVESEVPGFTEKAINTVEVPAYGNVTVGQTPMLRTGAIPAEVKTAALHYKVSLADGTRIDEQTYPVKVFPKDTMVWEVKDGDEEYDMAQYIAAWVTPHAAVIDPLMRKAAEYHPEKSIAGYQCGESCSEREWADYSNAQVKAIFTALKNDYRITYINSPIAFGSGGDNPQRVRLPKDAIAANSANCIDGTVLYASALESIGMNPHIIILPTHAFVCYDTKPDAEGITCIETTMTGSATFEEAVAAAEEEYQEEITNGNFRSGASRDYSLAELRAEGILPME
ncbi:hypothetical protein [Methanoregula sp.]|uniref:hypothetical protein n=1 Tax=Methanoregula sp. TaxID=2052170 RepID=UPI00262E4C13|nr:hypothetical protein [Methanoregula sp.]MDD5144037.1 hypothetical protein [Methanoregula sp.]